MPGPIQFVDHYAVIGCSPETPVDEIKKAYHEKLREFHPDKRPWSAGGGHGQKVTQALTEAWEALRFPALRGAYDILWQRERRTTSSRPTPLSPPQERACAPPEQSPWERAELCRSEGNELYKRAQALMKQAGDGADSLSIRMQAMQGFQATIEKYSHGLKLAPQSHRLWSNRALCHASLREWDSCREDAIRVTQLKPDFAKGWFLLAKAMWKEGSAAAALRQIEVSLRVVLDTSDLLALQEEILKQVKDSEGHVVLPKLPTGYGGRSRNVSPCFTPTPGSRATSRSPTPGACASYEDRPDCGRNYSRSPGAGSRRSMQAAPPRPPRSRSVSPSPATEMGRLPSLRKNVAAAFAALGAEDDDDEDEEED
ncbi:unnamed protein product [Polarella glacialis]|uniref:J domain-containing protein n=1 Tax=Polarella glacialis TaxID=89957 RepID=A0A813L9L6_POLGL|nr:unnamed protein product [Polarella glacialis]CAE8722331.1 unnamed protein product [Polarella glacialis]